MSFLNELKRKIRPPYVIAEIGANHMGDMDLCKQIVSGAKAAGASAVKFQKRDNISLFTRESFDRAYDSENAFGRTYGEHREALELSVEQLRDIKTYCASIGIDFGVTAFDLKSLEQMIGLRPDFLKVASGDIDNHQLLGEVSSSGIPFIISTGASDISTVDAAVKICSSNEENFGLLQCTSLYPAPPEFLNLQVIKRYEERYPSCTIGYSGHDNGYTCTIAALAMGARIIEKHFTLDRSWKGTDQSFSLSFTGMRTLCKFAKKIDAAMGDGIKKLELGEEIPIKKQRKSLYFADVLPAGHVLTEDDFVAKIPPDGVSPSVLKDIVGRTLKVDVAPETLFSYSMVDGGGV